MSRARDMANLGSQAGSGLDASDITTGVLPVGVTGGSGLTALGTVTAGDLSNTAIVYPSGHVSNVFPFTYVGGDYSNTVDTEKVAFDAVEWAATSGRKYVIHACVDWYIARGAVSDNPMYMYVGLYYGTTDRAAGATTTDTQISYYTLGQRQEAEANAWEAGVSSPIGFFTAGSTAPHFAYFTLKGADANSLTATLRATSTQPGMIIIYEIMP